MLPALRRFPRLLWILLAIEAALLALLIGGLGVLVAALPEEGVKLHGNVNTGVDLLGSRNDLLWVGVFGLLVFLGNTLLAWVVAARERAAAYFLVSASMPVLLLLIGVTAFLAKLNRLW